MLQLDDSRLIVAISTHGGVRIPKGGAEGVDSGWDIRALG
jgi:hypothetical protein